MLVFVFLRDRVAHEEGHGSLKDIEASFKIIQLNLYHSICDSAPMETCLLFIPLPGIIIQFGFANIFLDLSGNKATN